MMDITEVPQVPPHIKGVLNLRGKVIPVIDLRIKFGFAPGDATSRTCIIVVDVADVLNIVAEEIEQTPEFGDRVCTDYMTGVAKVKGTVKILLDLDRVLGTEDA